MGTSELVRFWKESAENDLRTAENLLKLGDYAWCLFILHLVIEKKLKAAWIRDNRKDLPPRTHNLLRLAEETNLKLSKSQKLFLLEINDFNIEARYPDYKRTFHRKCTRAFAQKYMKQAREINKWLSMLI